MADVELKRIEKRLKETADKLAQIKKLLEALQRKYGSPK